MASILDNSDNRFVLFPIKHDSIWQMYKKAVSAFWTAEEVDLSKDYEDWIKLNSNEQHFIKHILAFFAASDGIVNENLAVRFMNDIGCQEAKCFYGFQIAMENIHSEMYSLMIDTYIKDREEKSHLLNAVNTISTITKKADWALRWIEDKNSSFATRLVAFACVEGIFFSGAFCSIFWLKERGIMPGLTLSNEFISRDESLHTEFAILLYSLLPEKLDKDIVLSIIQEAVDIEEEFIIDSIPCNLLGMNNKLMRQYIQFVADRLIIQLGYDPVYNVNNPFTFMDRISLTNKTNFFEHTRQSEYARARVGNDAEENTFELDADF